MRIHPRQPQLPLSTGVSSGIRFSGEPQDKGLSAERTPENKTVIFYDGECPICQRGKKILESVDHTGRFALVPLQSPLVPEKYPELSLEAMRKTMHILTSDGQVYTGAAAYREVGKVVSLRSVTGVMLRVYSWLVRLPGALMLAEKVYRLVAGNRFQILPSVTGSCDGDSCRIPR